MRNSTLIDAIRGLALAATLVGLAGAGGCSARESECESDADCGARRSCVSAGGVLVSGGTCVRSAFEPVSVDAFDDGDTDASPNDSGRTDANTPSIAPRLQFGSADDDWATALALSPGQAHADGRVYVGGTTADELPLGAGSVIDTNYVARWSRETGFDFRRPVPKKSIDGVGAVEDLALAPEGRVVAVGGVGASKDDPGKGFVSVIRPADGGSWTAFPDRAQACPAAVVPPTDGDTYAVVACNLVESGRERPVLFAIESQQKTRRIWSPASSSVNPFGNSDGRVKDLAAGPNGRIFVAGWGGAETGNAKTGRDGFVLALRSTGTIEWSYASDWNGADSIVSLAIPPDADGSVYVGGDVEQPPGNDDSAGALLQKLQSDGSTAWYRTLPELEGVAHLEIDSDRARLFVGSSSSLATFALNGRRESEARQLLPEAKPTIRDIEWNGDDETLLLAGSTFDVLPNASNAGSRDAFLYAVEPR